MGRSVASGDPLAPRELLVPAVRRRRLLAWRNVQTVLDVGANEGQYAQRLRAAGFNGRIVSYEPGEIAFARLKANAQEDPDWECNRLALGDRDGTATLSVADDTEGSSLPSRSPRNPTQNGVG